MTDNSRFLLEAINEMIKVTTARTLLLHTTLPGLILGVLSAISLLAAFLAGYAVSKRKVRSRLHFVFFAISISLMIYAVIDIDRPRSGLIRLTVAERMLKQLHQSLE